MRTPTASAWSISRSWAPAPGPTCPATAWSGWPTATIGSAPWSPTRPATARSAPRSTAGTLTFSNLTDSGSPDTPPVTTDGTFELSLSGDADANGVSVVYQQKLGAGAWTDLPGNSLVGLADGDYRFRAVVTDPAGNSSISAAIEVVVDNTAPTAGTLTFSNLTDSGSPDTPPVTTDGTFELSLSGDADANGVSVVYQQKLGAGAWTDLPGNSLVGLADGDYRFRAVVTDPAGNSSISAAIEVVVDNTAPTAGTLTFSNLTDSGSPDTPPVTTDGTFELSLSGDADANGVSVVYQQKLGAGAWTDLPGNSLVGLADGDYRFRAVVTDPAGNSSISAAIEVVVDNTAPTAGTLTFSNLTDTGRTTDAIPVTTDNAFDLSLSGQEAGTDVTYQKSLNGGAFSTTTASQSGLA